MLRSAATTRPGLDGEIDEGIERLILYEDGDGDGYSHPELQVERCEALEGLVEAEDDCNDEDQVNRATEVLDKTDVDFSFLVDDLTTDESIARLSRRTSMASGMPLRPATTSTSGGPRTWSSVAVRAVRCGSSQARTWRMAHPCCCCLGCTRGTNLGERSRSSRTSIGRACGPGGGCAGRKP